MTLIQRARYVAAPREGALLAESAHVKDGTLVLMSKLPESTAEAERINAQVMAFIALHNERSRQTA